MTLDQLCNEVKALAHWFSERQITPHDAVIVFALVLQTVLKTNPLDIYQRSGILGIVEAVLRDAGISPN